MKKNLFFLLVLLTTFAVQATDLTGIKIYINPGHGGYDSNDRSVWTIPVPETWTNPDGFWESKSNLIKGLALRDMLEAVGATVIMSRVENTSGTLDNPALIGGGDRVHSEFAEEANANEVDHFLSIHSNAGGANLNHLLLLFRGYDNRDSFPPSLKMCQNSWPLQLDNPLTVWTQSYVYICGDFSFYPERGDEGLVNLASLTVPGFLSEGSYHSYSPETHRLCSEDYCKLEALRIFRHMYTFFEGGDPTTGTIAGWVKSENESATTLNQSRFTFVSGSDDQWRPLNGATVELLDASGENVLDTYITDGWYNGIFTFFDVAPGDYQLRVRMNDDYDEKTVDITVTAAQIAYAKVQLKNNAIFQFLSPADASNDLPLTPSFTWKEISPTASYMLEISSNNQFSALVYSNTVQTTECTVPEKILVMGNSYYARVTGTDGGTKTVSPTISFTVALLDIPVPTITSPANDAGISGTSLVVTWEEQLARGFRAQLSTSASFPVIGLQTKTTGPYVYSTQFDGLRENTTYYIRVAAQVAGAGFSANSDVVKVTMGVTGITAVNRDNICISRNGNQITITSGNPIQSVILYNLQGITVTSEQGIAANVYSIPAPEKGVYVLKTQMTNGFEDIQKIVVR